MEISCPIDEQYASEISALLKPPPPPHLVQEYYDQLLESRQCHSIRVKQEGEFGKGVYANADFKEGELLLRDEMLFGCQHSSNKIDCLVCSFCFCFIGSIELQIGRRLYFQDVGVHPHHGCGAETFSGISNNHQGSDSSNGEDIPYGESYDNMETCGPSSKAEIIPLPKEIVQSLMNGELKLPCSEKFYLPSVVPCSGGCKEAYYCSKQCAEADWSSFHSLLCTGERSEASSREVLVQFIKHANETNDIFLLAAKAISFTILRYRKLKAARLSQRASLNISNSCDLSLLMEAWRPISVGHKKRWWECVALPEDVASSDEAAFRMQIKDLAFTSLQLLRAAIFDRECALLFSLEIYGHIIGMFELNNLDLVVASPVEDYFLYIDDRPSSEKEEAEKVTRPILDALRDEYAVICEGSAFFPLQSCMNHSCRPNAKAFKRDEDRDGRATIIAQIPIRCGDEVTISYIDEDLTFEERQAALADYGFICRCSKCQEEET
ncbi:histone-lysine N-methyltransferase ATXR2 [Punica granatum]|uniref:Histone-lysine N-methyltransferase ATXR2 n=1 Tax=Punica granatum TaxID=22663 RepID=A0A6P8CRA7_PUNGR|nr:histone-lysine N-methyltransferase ATXR2 [Punica granatum]